SSRSVRSREAARGYDFGARRGLACALGGSRAQQITDGPATPAAVAVRERRTKSLWWTQALEHPFGSTPVGPTALEQRHQMQGMCFLEHVFREIRDGHAVIDAASDALFAV